MNMQYELTTPCTAQDLAPLQAGDTVLLSGVDVNMFRRLGVNLTCEAKYE